MLGTLLAKVFGTQNERELKAIRPLVEQINALEPSIQALSDEQLRAKTAEFRARVVDGQRSTICCPRPSPWCARRAAAC